MVATKRHIVYRLIYRLLKLAMVLAITTSTIKRSFSAMKIVKTILQNHMRDQWMNDYLMTYTERDVFNNINDKLITQ